MRQRLPETANFIELAEKHWEIEGGWPIAELGRLSNLDVLSGSTGQLTARLKFDTRAGVYCLQGSFEAALSLICERCLQNMDYTVSGQFLFGLIKTEDEAINIPSDMEPYQLKAEEQSIIDLLEDELLLLLPIAPTHEQDCSEILQQLDKRRQDEKMASSPFSVLKNLKLE